MVVGVSEEKLLNLEFLFLHKKIFMRMLMKFMLHLAVNTLCPNIVLDVVAPIYHLSYHVNVENWIDTIIVKQGVLL